MPGLLQTEDYAHALIRARRPHDDEEAVERTLRGRMERQDILSRPKAPKLWYVLSEGVLRQCTGGVEVMGGQLDKLIKAAETPGSSTSTSVHRCPWWPTARRTGAPG